MTLGERFSLSYDISGHIIVFAAGYRMTFGGYSGKGCAMREYGKGKTVHILPFLEVFGIGTDLEGGLSLSDLSSLLLVVPPSHLAGGDLSMLHQSP